MNKQQEKRISKFLSLVLRHQPDIIGINLDKQAWTDVEQLLKKSQKKGRYISREMLDYVVANNDKKRFAFSEDGSKIRASQGHSIQVDLGYTKKEPPKRLYHGTHIGVEKIIQREGLKKMNRHHVHLSGDTETANRVGQRRGKVVMFVVDTAQMYKDGHTFYQSQNGVWLTDVVPAQYLSKLNE